MAKTKTFSGVAPAAWECVKSTSERQHGTKYVPPGGNQGTATTSTLVGSVVLNFHYDPRQERLVYTLVKKPFVVTDGQIWGGIQETIDDCKR